MWQARGYLTVREAVELIAHHKFPEAGVVHYAAPPWPRDGVIEQFDGPACVTSVLRDPHFHPRQSQDDLAFLALQDGRRSLLQALGDEQLTVIHKRVDGTMLPESGAYWRSRKGWAEITIEACQHDYDVEEGRLLERAAVETWLCKITKSHAASVPPDCCIGAGHDMSKPNKSHDVNAELRPSVQSKRRGPAPVEKERVKARMQRDIEGNREVLESLGFQAGGIGLGLRDVPGHRASRAKRASVRVSRTVKLWQIAAKKK